MVKREDSREEGTQEPSARIDTSGVVVAGKTDLDQLAAGKIDVAEYVRRQAESATAHLVGRVSEERLIDLRELLAAQVLSDPSLQAVIQTLRDSGAGTPA